MALILISLLVTIFVLIFTYVRRLYTYWDRRGVPHERPEFPLGHLKGIGTTVHFRDINRRIYKAFKGKAPFTGMYFTTSKVAMILDLDLAKNILIKDFGNFRNRGLFSNPRDDPLSGHLFNLDGEPWRALRTKLTPVFTSGKMKFMFPTIVAVSENLSKACGLLAASAKDGTLDVKELCARYTTDVIGTCAFGLECNSLKNPDAEFRVMGRKIFEKVPHSLIQTFMITFPDLARKLHMKFFSPEVTEFFVETVRKTVEYRLKNKIKRNDFMELLMEMGAGDNNDYDEGAEAKRSRDIELSYGLTIEQMAAQTFVFFLAGFETSSTTMAFCLYELAMNINIQEKLNQEIKEVLEKHNGELTYKAMNEMVYLEQVLMETLRKYPVLPHLTRMTKEDYKVPNSNFVIEAGTSILIPTDAFQYDNEYFPKPEKFNPERFNPEETKNRSAMVFIPFGDGPRNCIGMRFGKMQAKIGLINLLKNYKFIKSKLIENPIELENKNFIISAKNGIYLNIERL